MKLVSIIIPSYNHSDYIQQAVESVLIQSHSNIELIVIDDGSTDTTLNYLRKVHDPRFTLVEQANAGAHDSINKGLSLARGQYLAILNSDDVFHPERIAVCISRLKEGTDLVASWIEVINQKGMVLGIKEGWHNMRPWALKQPTQSYDQINDFTLNLLTSNFVSTTSNIVFTRKLYEKTGGMKNLRFAHDWDFLLRAAKNFKCELIEVPLLQYRIHQNNTISSNRAWMLFEICWIFAVHLNQFTTKIFSQSSSFINLVEEINFYSQSVNLQGNDKVMWMLLQYISDRKKKGELTPEDNLIENEALRNLFIKQIVL